MSALAKVIKQLDEVLDLSLDARMGRAKEQGFDTDQVFYHGTGNLEGFDKFDPALTGKGNDQYGSGFYSTSSPATASGYATARNTSNVEKLGGEGSAGVMPLRVKGNFKEVDGSVARNMGDVFELDRDQVRAMLDKSDALKRGLDSEDMNPMGDHYAEFWDSGPQEYMLDDLADKYAGRNVEEIEAELFDDAPDDFRRALSEVTGYDGIRVTFPDTGEVHAVSWFPENIRSVNAKFDPKLKDSADLMAGVGGTAVGLGALTGSNEADAGVLGKILDLSLDARMGRAKEQGYDDVLTYRGLTGDYDPDKAGHYQMFTSSKIDAGEYGDNVIPSKIRKGRNLQIDGGGKNFNNIYIGGLPSEVFDKLHPSIRENLTARTDNIAHAAKAAGYDSVTINNIYDKASNEIPIKPKTNVDQKTDRDILSDLGIEEDDPIFSMETSGSLQREAPKDYGTANIDIVFDPKNIRSVNARFDPKLKDSADLMAGVGGVGVGLGALAGSNEADAGVLGKVLRGAKDAASPRNVGAGATFHSGHVNGLSMSSAQMQEALARGDFAGVGNSIEGATNEITAKVYGSIAKINRRLKQRGMGLLALEGIENWTQKAAYGDDITVEDRVMAALDVMP